MKLKVLNTLFLLLIIFLAGCKKDTPNNIDDEDDDEPIEEVTIFGMWELTGFIEKDIQYDNQGDVYYTNITENSITDYDFMGDSYDQGDDCYEIFNYEVTFDGNSATIKEGDIEITVKLTLSIY